MLDQVVRRRRLAAPAQIVRRGADDKLATSTRPSASKLVPDICRKIAVVGRAPRAGRAILNPSASKRRLKCGKIDGARRNLQIITTAPDYLRCRPTRELRCRARFQPSHSKYAIMRLLDWSIERRTESDCQCVSGVDRIKNAVVPDFGCRIVGARSLAIFF
jgi:hypothetical protein